MSEFPPVTIPTMPKNDREWLDRSDAFSFPIPSENYAGRMDDQPAVIEFKGKGWSVNRGGRFCLNKKTLDFEYEPYPSNRDEDFFKTCRFKTKEGALRALIRWCKKAVKLAKERTAAIQKAQAREQAQPGEKKRS